MSHDLVQMEKEARAYRNAGMFDRAIELFSSIAERQPNWENGICYYEMAGCYEDLGKIDEARRYYQKALNCDPNYDVYLGGWASFLYLHAPPQEAFDAYLKMLKLASIQKNNLGFERAKIALQTLGRRLGMADEEIMIRIRLLCS
jgi:tetratricopeptide (TPR) repeat protein